MRIRMLFLAAVFALAACATADKYEEVLDTWLGSSEAEIVSAWGPPASVYQAPDGTRILTYQRGGSVRMPGTPATYQTTRVGNTAYTTQTGGSPGYDIQLSCRTNITVGADGRISSWSFQGNNCVSR